MVRFNKIIIENFKSIGSATLEFNAGIYKIIGQNKGAYSSNGAAKSSLTQALIVGLFRRDVNGATLDELTNRNSNAKTFRIVIAFSHEDSEYTVETTRTSMTIVKNGKILINGIQKSLAYILNIIGMGYETFVLTQYVTQQTVSHLTANLTQPTLFNDVLQIVQLKTIDNQLKLLAKTQESIRAENLKFKSQLETKLEHSHIEDRFDVDSLVEAKEFHEVQIQTLEVEKFRLSSEITPILDKERTQLSKYKAQISTLEKSILEGICDTCGTKLDNTTVISKTIEKLEPKVYALEESIEASLELLESKTLEIQQDIELILLELQEIDSELSTAKLLTRFSADIVTNLEEDILEYKDKINAQSKIIEFINIARTGIRKGDIVKELLTNFFAIVQARLLKYSTLINTDGIDIRISTNKLGMQVTLFKDAKSIPISTLSNGEKTRISMLLLVSILDSIKIATNTETNFLVFDEASGAFDAKGHSELSALFSYLKDSLGTAIFTITHGSELDSIPYDYQITMLKENNESKLQIHKL